LSVWPWLK